MRKTSKALAMLTVLPLAFALQGCGGEDSKVRVTPPSQDHVLYQPGTHPRFDPGGSDLPFNNDLIFLTPANSEGDAFDGTANIAQPSNPVIDAVNALDGFSTNAPFDILISGSVNPASVIGGATVFLVELTSNGEVLDPGNITGVAGLAEIDAEVISVDGGVNNAIRIIPKEPLQPATKYLVFVTNNVVDAQGEPLTTSWAYNALRGDSFNATGALATVRQLVRAWDGIAGSVLVAGSGGLLPLEDAIESVVIAYTFTTTDPITPLLAMAAPRAALVQAAVNDFGIPPADAVGMVQILDSQVTLSTPQPRELGIAMQTEIDLSVLTGGLLPADVGYLYTGFIKLPYYLDAPQQGGDTSYTRSSWSADQTLGYALGAGLPGAPALPPSDVDGTTYNVTYRYPFAGQKGTESVPLQVTLPDAANTPAYLGGATCGMAYGASGYPVVIYAHGITSDRSSVVTLAHSLADNCVATVSVDLPLHGVSPTSSFAVLNVESSPMIPFDLLYGVDAPRERFFNDPGGSGAQFINLANLTNTRDNLRQGVMDLLNLNASLDEISMQLDAQGLGALDTSNVKVVGVSLGGMVASVMTTINQMAIGAEAATVAFASNLNPISGLAASVAGTQLTQILLNSDTFGPVIRGGLADAGVVPGSVNFERFIFAAQSTVDSADPVNFAATLGALGVPVLLQQVNGDTVVPNEAPGLPLAATAGLIKLTGASQSGPSPAPVDMASAPGVVKMLNGGHGSLLDPSAGLSVTTEMQAQVVSFVISGGAQVAVGAGSPADVEAP
ncbi:hypothetical protein [Alcanivorax quisquiliarum]|uniref:Bacterial virulence factor lipase N-terminal domain-containing protein n=1 Tax=Alcanivorax quisquiliarum TaxID=2933565 RepID=A0ABT0E4C1_9GAMM|nr:hypothetical protein [Alcanivorax quisquiliarum]MCK0536472.1 hypothetical protein [Alcanivorax quisquiliarum]